MSMLKQKKFGLPIALLMILLSLTFVILLPIVAEDGDQENTYFTVVAIPEVEDQGTVTVTVSDLNDQNEEGDFRYGAEITLEAVAKPGYEFVRWEGSSYVYFSSFTLTVVDTCSYTAIFKPLTYDISYVDVLDDGTGVHYDNNDRPMTHTYGKATVLPIPKEIPGYTFVGWKAVSGGVEKDYIKGASLGAHDYQENITLYPKFTKNNYKVTCYDYTETGVLLGIQEKEYPYRTTDIPVEDWVASEYAGYTHAPEKYVPLAEYVQVNTTKNIVKRIYTANKYTVTLNNAASDAVGGKTQVTATFAQPFPNLELTDLPTRTGFTCLGYYLDVNENDKYDQGDKMYCVRDASTKEWVSFEIWDVAEDTTLKALWHRNDYKLTFDFGDDTTLTEQIVVTIVSKDGTVYGADDVIPFDTALVITVQIPDGYKLVKWNGQAISHVSEYTDDTFVLLADSVIEGVVLQEYAIPMFSVNYADELFVYNGGVIPDGVYRLVTDGANDLYFTVENGEITLADETVLQALSATPYLGKTVYLVRCGDGVTMADSDALELAVSKRPSAPVLGHNVYLENGNKNITVQFMPNFVIPDGLEFACSDMPSATDDGSDLIWQSTLVFENLHDGTPYYVYVRRAATESAPHGIAAYIGEKTTLYQNYVDEKIQYIIQLMKEGIVGENVKKLIEDAKAELNALETSATFYDEVSAIVKRVEDNIEHARQQDIAMEALTAKYNELLQTDRYGEELGIPKLNTLYETASVKISAAKNQLEVDEILEDTLTAFDLVPISHLYVGDNLVLYAEKGLDKEYSLSMKPQYDSLATIAAKIQRAINAGTIVPGGVSMTYTDIRDALKTMDVLGYYLLKLAPRDGAEIHTPAQGPYEIRLLLPDDLRDDTGFMVAYYDENTEELTVLETRREGNWLIFVAPQSVENFVVLGDHAVNLTWICMMLSVVLLIQIIAIMVIVSRRRKYKQQMRLSSLALPTVALTVRFFPVPVAKAVAILAGLVVICQIILMCLLVKTDVVPVRKTRRTQRAKKPAKEKSSVEEIWEDAQTVPAEEEMPETEDAYVPVTEEESFETESDISEEESVWEDGEHDLSDAEEPTDYAEMSEEQAYSEEPYEETVLDEATEAEWYGDEDFIEPAPNPDYSLPNDGYEPYSDDAGEDVADAEDPNGYSMEYDSDTNGYSLEFDNEPVEYTEAEFDGEGEGFVEYDETEYEGEAEYYGDTEDATPEIETVDYGYDVELSDDVDVVSDYVTAEDVIRDEDYEPSAEETQLPSDELPDN